MLYALQLVRREIARKDISGYNTQRFAARLSDTPTLVLAPGSPDCPHAQLAGSAMSSLSASIPTNIPAFAIPIINEYAKQIKPPVAFLMVGTVFATMLVPLLLSLFYFSTKEQRCRPIFILVVFDVLLGIALGVWNGFIMVSFTSKLRLLLFD